MSWVRSCVHTKSSLAGIGVAAFEAALKWLHLPLPMRRHAMIKETVMAAIAIKAAVTAKGHIRALSRGSRRTRRALRRLIL